MGTNRTSNKRVLPRVLSDLGVDWLAMSQLNLKLGCEVLTKRALPIFLISPPERQEKTGKRLDEDKGGNMMPTTREEDKQNKSWGEKWKIKNRDGIISKKERRTRGRRQKWNEKSKRMKGKMEEELLRTSLSTDKKTRAKCGMQLRNRGFSGC